MCRGPPEAGMCRAAMKRFYFNAQTQSCESFIYGGCGGNSNNYMSESECMLNCKGLSTFCPKPCNAVADSEFPRGGGANPPEGHQHMILPNVPKNCMKLKKFGPQGHTPKILLCRSATAMSWDIKISSVFFLPWRVCLILKIIFKKV